LKSVDLPTFGKPTIPSFIFYVSPSKNALFKPFVISAYCTEYHAGHHLSIMT
jgi:hypothetical protein